MTQSLSSLRRFFAGLALLAVSMPGWSQPIGIAYYDINDAVLSGHGNWFHNYSGNITPGNQFTNLGNAGTLATYQGGSGTLNDGVIGGGINSQLFVSPAASDGTPIHPTLFLTLDTSQSWLVDRIEIYGGDMADNRIPGAITSFEVGIIGPNGGAANTPFTTTAFGPALNKDGIFVNDSVDLSASILATTPAWALVLSNFQGTVGDWFSITEIKVYGEAVSNVPLPASAWLMLSALTGLLAMGKRKI
ncbi:MAG: VPLPA-CTERM sorting domain-containing protein [Methylomonas sp.]|nr:VPLPA-CTERM sorting domain-containing protein [Methylomonas sp.]